ncbi:MAG: MBL fold metallo-hydrolase RNA specificity domain-containing protein [Armatimonadota bacterium]|nr:MBL fold metallo-hydrolase RNA specificity domain-containing protein [Armatimonadota bacterium]
MATITCFDGVGCIGGNKIFLKDKNTGLWFDFGLNVSHMGKFYEEYLQPKTCLGLYEPIQMGLIPPISNLYREDLESSIANPWEGVEIHDIGETHGILISHGHLDHLGSIHYVKGNIPIYCSAMTLALAKACQDIGMGNECSYISERREKPTGELEVARDQPTVSRPYCLTDEEPNENLIEFWNSTPSSRKAHKPKPIIKSSKCGDLNIYRFSVDHSIYGASAWAVETSEGWLVYTGDLRCHGTACHCTWDFADKVKKLKPRALIIEGTRINSNTKRTEEDVYNNALQEVKKAEGLVVADFNSRNVERLNAFLKIAKETDRKLAILTKDAYLIRAMRLVDSNIPSLDDDNIVIYSEFEATTTNWKKSIKDEYKHKLIEPKDVRKNQDKFICCFRFFDVNELALIKPIAGSIWIYSSCEAFNEEMKIDQERLKAWLEKYDMVFLGGTDDDQGNPFHVSGHANGADILKLIEEIQPEIVIPIHTEEKNLSIFNDSLKGKCQVKVPEVGVPINLY